LCRSDAMLAWTNSSRKPVHGARTHRSSQLTKSSHSIVRASAAANTCHSSAVCRTDTGDGSPRRAAADVPLA
jgi:hypothetical protein